MRNIWTWVVVIVVLVGGLFWWWQNNQAPAPVDRGAATQVPQTGTQPTDTSIPGAAITATVTYGAQGFSPSTVTIKQGGTVTFVASSGSDEMWIASNPHPSHQGYDGTTRSEHCATGYAGAAPFDQCAAGTSYSFTFQKIGTWGYHNHGNPRDGGTVVVVQ